MPLATNTDRIRRTTRSRLARFLERRRESCRGRGPVSGRRVVPNKAENLHALRRELAYVGEGADPAPALRTATEQMWCLTLVTTTIVTWPSRHANVNFYGTQAGLFGLADAVRRFGP
ncbi:hypothetical protein [Streptomyces coeruleorubidus]|uniref:hypothetical protein n=1 Tax=Streptomyces coeruleorubidus TaxID=116188 RepID=UPI0033A5DB41